MTANRALMIVFLVFAIMLYAYPASAQGEFRFDFAAKVAGIDNYTKHWSNTYPPDPKADIIIYSYAANASYKRMSALNFLYVVYDPRDNVVAVDKITSFKRSYDPNVVYYTLHPGSDWIEGTYRVRVIVYDRIDRDAYDDKITKDPFGIGIDPDNYKTFYETGNNAGDMGVLLPLGNPVAQAILNFKIDKTATLFPPDRFLLHDARFVDKVNERIIGEKFQIEVKIDNNYREDGTVKLAMLVDNSMVSTKEVAVKGLDTSTVVFDAKAGKAGTFKLNFGADTADVKYRNAELTFSIKNETDSDRLDIPRITVTGMNMDKEFVTAGESVTASVKVINDGRTGTGTITVYSNKVPVGSTEVHLQYLEEKTVEIPVILPNTGINRITVSDAPSLYRNVFVEEPESLKENPVAARIMGSPVKLSMIAVFMVFAGVLYYVKRRLS